MGDLWGLSALLELPINIANSALSYNQNKWNKEMAEKQHQLAVDQFQYQKDLNKQIMSREDTAVQRRSADLEATGLSKNLAAGQSASTGVLSGNQSQGGSQVEPPDMGVNMSGIIDAINNTKLVNAEVGHKKAQAIVELAREGLITKEEAKVEAETSVINETKDAVKRELVTRADRNQAEAKERTSQAERNKHDLEVDKRRGTKQGDTTNSIWNAIKDVFTTGENITDAMINRAWNRLSKDEKQYFDDYADFKKFVMNNQPKYNHNHYKKDSKDDRHYKAQQGASGYGAIY